MSTNTKEIEAALIACEICMKEIPTNDAITPETDDYVAHFCGLDCYELWKNQGAKLGDGQK